MNIIKRFVIDKATATLSILDDNAEQDNSKAIKLSFEYLRVFAPTNDKGQAIGSTPKVFHKKQVQLLKIESVAKHGYRFIFDDHHSNIYSDDYLQLLTVEYQQRWQRYQQSTDTAINSREATIEIKEVK
tara:strand:+ start:25044 stop:25430 length:387 start_codon:yes stop_codon:yes gene_type:complete